MYVVMKAFVTQLKLPVNDNEMIEKRVLRHIPLIFFIFLSPL